jgi:hypothetical protein
MRTVVAIAASFALLAPLACSPDSSARHRGLVTAGLASPVAEETAHTRIPMGLP